MNHLLGWSFLKGSTTTPTSQGDLLPWLKPCTMKSLSMKMVSLMVGHLVCETCCDSDFGIVLFGRSILIILICTKLNMFQILCIFLERWNCAVNYDLGILGQKNKILLCSKFSFSTKIYLHPNILLQEIPKLYSP